MTALTTGRSDHLCIIDFLSSVYIHPELMVWGISGFLTCLNIHKLVLLLEYAGIKLLLLVVYGQWNDLSQKVCVGHDGCHLGLVFPYTIISLNTNCNL